MPAGKVMKKLAQPTSWLGRTWQDIRLIFGLLTDLSFRHFITPRLVRLLYLLSLIGAALSALAWMASGFKVSLIYGCFTLLTGPLAFFLYMLAARVVLEVVLAVFRIAENTDRLRERDDVS